MWQGLCGYWQIGDIAGTAKVTFTLKQAIKGRWGVLAALPPGKEKHYPLYRRLGGPGQVQSISPLLQFDPQTIQLVASHYTSYAILAKLLN